MLIFRPKNLTKKNLEQTGAFFPGSVDDAERPLFDLIQIEKFVHAPASRYARVVDRQLHLQPQHFFCFFFKFPNRFEISWKKGPSAYYISTMGGVGVMAKPKLRKNCTVLTTKISRMWRSSLSIFHATNS